MENKKRKLQIKLWFGAVLGSIIAFLILKLLWKEANPMLLLVFLMLSFLINLITPFTIKATRKAVMKNNVVREPIKELLAAVTFLCHKTKG